MCNESTCCHVEKRENTGGVRRAGHVVCDVKDSLERDLRNDLYADGRCLARELCPSVLVNSNPKACFGDVVSWVPLSRFLQDIADNISTTHSDGRDQDLGDRRAVGGPGPEP